MKTSAKIIKELLYCLLIFLCVSVLTFTLGRLAPGDAVDNYLKATDTIVTDVEREAARKYLGLDQPVSVQFFRWLFNAVRGDFGISYSTGRPVLQEILFGLPVTLRLTVYTLAVTLLLSVPSAWLCAVRCGKFADHFVRFLNTLVMALPTFSIGLFIMLILGVRLKWFPIVSGTGFQRYVMPTLTLSVAMSAGMIRFFRTQFLEVLETEHVLYARAMGVSWARVFAHHILPNTAFPIITYLGMRLGRLLGGSYLIETMFALNGAGGLLVNAVGVRDYPLIQGYALFMARYTSASGC